MAVYFSSETPEYSFPSVIHLPFIFFLCSSSSCALALRVAKVNNAQNKLTQPINHLIMSSVGSGTDTTPLVNEHANEHAEMLATKWWTVEEFKLHGE